MYDHFCKNFRMACKDNLSLMYIVTDGIIINVRNNDT